MASSWYQTATSQSLWNVTCKYLKLSIMGLLTHQLPSRNFSVNTLLMGPRTGCVVYGVGDRAWRESPYRPVEERA